MSGYVWPNLAAEPSRARFDGLEALYDHATFKYLASIDVAPGWDCLEAGAGGGSVARWLARIVRPGKVTAGDLNPVLCSGGGATVIRQDVRTDELGGPYDLIHARLLMYHLPERAAVLEKMAAALKPGGWLVVEDFDNGIVPDPAPTDPSGLFSSYWLALNELFTSRGANPFYARHLPALMEATPNLGFLDMDAHLVMSQGRSPGARLQAANIRQSAAELAATGCITLSGLDQLLDMLADPGVFFFQPVMITAIGRRSW